MPFVVEDGTGLADANSYGSVTDADTYHEDRGNETWLSLSPHAKQSALIKATDYIDQRYGTRFYGTAAVPTQALEWPRTFNGQTYEEVTGVEGEIPRDLQYACFEYATRAVTSPLAPDPAIDASGVTVVATHQRVGEVERSFSPVGMSGSGQMWLVRPYPAADMYLRDLVSYSSGGDRVIR